MTLAAATLRSLLATSVEIGLAFKGKEIPAVDGYNRVRVPLDRWNIRGSRASVEVTFGPMVDGVDYDAGVIFIDGEPERLMPNPGGEAGRIPPRATLRYEAAITVV